MFNVFDTLDEIADTSEALSDTYIASMVPRNMRGLARALEAEEVAEHATFCRDGFIVDPLPDAA